MNLFVITIAAILINSRPGLSKFNCELFKIPVSMPLEISKIIPENKVAHDANAVPKQRGKANKFTTSDAGKSLQDDFKITVMKREIIEKIRDSRSYIRSESGGGRCISPA